MWLSYFTFLSIFYFSHSTLFDFYTIAKCQHLTRTWCVMVFHLEVDSFDYDDLGITDVHCFRGPAAPFFNFRKNLTSDGTWASWHQQDFEIAVGFRHNCTKNGRFFDWIGREEKWRMDWPYMKYSTTANLEDYDKDAQRFKNLTENVPLNSKKSFFGWPIDKYED